MILTPRDVEVRHFHLFCGLGGGAKGFNRGQAKVGHLRAKFRCIGGVDSDAAAIRDFDRLAGVKGTVLDLFSRDQYTRFHGEAPPDGWREATPADIRRAAGGERPHIGFGSAPCKGFSGLLSESKSKSDKYDALNQLAIRGLRLALEAWKDDPLEFWLWENVPRIATRGRAVLDEMIGLLNDFGYAVAETTHDCGELGGLAQSRKRFLLVARHREKVPPFLYEPIKRRVRGVGEVIGRLPVPGPGVALPMHRLPMLQWQTWVRLAFVEAGSDWRSLNRLQVADGVLKDFALMPSRDWNGGVLGVKGWDEHSATVTGRGSPTCGAYSVADPRAGYTGEYQQIGVRPWTEPSATVGGQCQVGGGPHSVADPRYTAFGEHSGKMRVEGWDAAAHTVTGSDRVGSGAMSVADPRPEWNKSYGGLGVNEWDEPTGTIIGVRAPGQGTFSVADPRLSGPPRFNNVFRIVPWTETSPAVAGAGGPGGGLAVADPGRAIRTPRIETSLRFTNGRNRLAPSPARTTSPAALCVADPRPPDGDRTGKGKYRVSGFDEPTGCVIAASTTGQGAFAVADPRVDQLRNSGLGVKEWTDAAGVVAGDSLPTNGAFAVADPRPEYSRAGKDVYKTTGEYGVVPWERSSGAVIAHGQHDNGRWSVADPREPASFDGPLVLPKATDRLIAVIRALDGTYHRPFTTLELAFIQSLFDDDDLLILEGKSDSAWRERIGNAVPPDAAEAIAGVMGTTLLLALSGETFTLNAAPIWVRPVAVALSVDQREAFQ